MQAYLKKQYATVLVVAVALNASILAFVAVAYGHATDQQIHLEALLKEIARPLISAQLAIAIVAIGLAWVVPGIVQKHFNKSTANLNREGLLQRMAGYRDRNGRPTYSEAELASFRNWSVEELRKVGRSGSYAVGVFVGLAISEAAATLGFAGSSIAHSFQVILPFAALSLATNLLRWPTRAEFDKQISEPGDAPTQWQNRPPA